MTNPADPTRDYDAALLIVMGCTRAAPPSGEHIHQLLLRPAFHPTCCLVLEDGSTCSLSITILLADTYDLLVALLRRDEAALLRPELWLPRARWEEIAALDTSQQQQFRNRMQRLRPDALPSINLAERDGIAIRYTLLEAHNRYDVAISSPTRAAARRHFELVMTFLELAERAFGQQQLPAQLAHEAPITRVSDYLDTLRNYLRA